MSNQLQDGLLVDVEYIGRRQSHTDTLYGTGLSFAPGQVRRVPAAAAVRMLRHKDVYRRPELTGAVPADKAPVPDPSADEEARLAAEKAKADAALKSEEEERAQAMRDALNAMDKDALADFASTHYKATLDKRRAVETLRQEVVNLFDQFGVE